MTDAAENVNQLVARLASEDAVERQKAREALVQTGSEAVSPLLDALHATQPHVRWEAAKSLGQIGDPAAAEGLVAALADEDNDVRWVAGEALVRLRVASIRPLLNTLTEPDLPHVVYSGAHHVLHELARRSELSAKLQPVLKAFNQPEPEIAVPVAAGKTLQSQFD